MFLVALVPGAAVAQVPPPIVNGAEVVDYPAVGAVVTDYGDELGYWICSGTLVAPSWVLTAAHCLDELPDGALSQQFILGDDIFERHREETRDVVGGTLHPDYELLENSLAADIALLELSEPICTTAPVQLRTEALDESFIGTELTFVGYGATGLDEGDEGLKRAVTIPISDFNDDVVFVYDPTGGRNTCVGDSGGPGLLVATDGSYVAAGINSYGTSYDDDDVQCADGGTAAMRVDAFYDFVASTADLDETSCTDLGDSGTPGILAEAEAQGCGCAASPRAPLPAAALALLTLRRRRRTRAERRDDNASPRS